VPDCHILTDRLPQIPFGYCLAEGPDLDSIVKASEAIMRSLTPSASEWPQLSGSTPGFSLPHNIL
jgi:hypothetical protein